VGLHVELSLIERAQLAGNSGAVTQRATRDHRRAGWREDVAPAIEQGERIVRGDEWHGSVGCAVGIILRRAAGQVCMRAIAERRRARVLAAAKQHLFAFHLRDVLQGLEAGARVRAVAEGLLLRTPATAPVVGAAGLKLHQKRFRAGDDRVHCSANSKAFAGRAVLSARRRTLYRSLLACAT